MAKFTADSRAQRIKQLIARLEAGKDIQARDLALVLTKAQLDSYEQRWAEQRRLRTESLPAEIAQYQRMLHRALMWEGRAEQFGGRTCNMPAKLGAKRRAQQKKLSNKSESLMEDAAEHLREELVRDSQVQMWLDRAIERSADGDYLIDTMDMPRVITSRSRENNMLGQGLAVIGKQSKRECKLDALREALGDLEAAARKDSAQSHKRLLAERLAALRPSRR